ncbi:Glycosyl transferase group 1 [Thiomonas arsenitoxydans]|uniref:Glycosyl transferase group 1 n=2 Tax=Thiomonas arsenitoxydans (strain DSM 22701 / CIP 110005 / 3As) TaxID=426114 RepID=A0ABP1Z085_THIA3|nr:glycosyltransferase family 4 protein [Thiomonas arsenitoxydans]CQR28127.1 Glycosyl transferase group 1 [Thiomonas arsenitoxydans]CQR28129.1 Glycosyl transferase group 1 [Thiomonas arsenitoxydans]CQR28718.1 Glycosyl transferase group 1 [Thiomonas arsenitoxydans]CQR31208.1 Glycosyl transferase group 1 [Thiomonas arsenitoxydans]
MSDLAMQAEMRAVTMRPGMKVAYFINQYPKVSHTFIRREIQALERQGISVQRIALRGWDAELVDAADRVERSQTQYILQRGLRGLTGPLFKSLLRHPVGMLRALAWAGRMSRLNERGLPYHLIYLVEACQLVLWVKAAGATHIHAHFGTNSAEVVFLARLLGGPAYSFTVHGPEEFDKPLGIHLKEKIEHSDFVVAISSFCRSQLFRWVGSRHWDKVHVVRCGIETSFHGGQANRCNTGRQLVCVGRLSEQKGHLLLLEAAALLVAEGEDFSLTLAGDGELRPEIEAAINRMGLRERVVITGWIGSPEVRQHLLQARALVLSSFAEGLPVVVMEAMALSRPVIATQVAAMSELVEDEKSGWLCPAGDAAALARAMQRCLHTSAERLDAMGAYAREVVMSKHDADVEALRLGRLFQRFPVQQGSLP